MEMQRAYEPLPAFQETDPAHLVLPAVPSHDVGSAQKIQLPCLRAVLSSEFDEVLKAHSRTNSASLKSTSTIPLLPRIEPLNDVLMSPIDRTPSRTQYSSSETSSRRVSDHYERGRAQNGLSMDDPDVRIAAEALSGLGNQNMADHRQAYAASHVRSPTQHSFHSSPAETLRDFEMQIDKSEDDPEPLLQLVAQAHPWVGGTINGGIQAYNATLHYSPHFIKYGAGLVEKNIATPVANTVGSVGRFTGVEDGLRRYLGGAGRQPNDLHTITRTLEKDPDSMDLDLPSIDESRRASAETLPAYRSSKPPSYREEISPAGTERSSIESRNAAATIRSWPSQVAGQIFVTTSGLGVALSITSRRSLQYCLSLLSQATEHVATVTKALRMVLEQYDQARVSWHRQQKGDMEIGDRPRTPDHDEASRRLAELIKQHCDDIWQTLKNVVNAVSNAAGGALPENARDFVRTQLMSLPQRWRIVSEQQSGESETSRGAHRMIAFATEGLDMMNQVSQVVRATLASAESWLDRVGRRDNERTSAYNEKNEMINATLRARPTAQ